MNGEVAQIELEEVNDESKLRLSAWLRQQAERMDAFSLSAYGEWAADLLRYTADSYEKMVDDRVGLQEYSVEVSVPKWYFEESGGRATEMLYVEAAKRIADEMVANGAIDLEELTEEENSNDRRKRFRAQLLVIQKIDQ